MKDDVIQIKALKNLKENIVIDKLENTNLASIKKITNLMRSILKFMYKQ